MSKFLAIAGNTFIQTIRQPIYLILLSITFLLLITSILLTAWTMGAEGGDYFDTDQKMLETVGLYTLMVSGMLIAAFSASNVISREIEDRTALTVVAKPVSRVTFVLAKFAGVALAVTAAYYLMSLGYMLTVRHAVMPTATDHVDVPVVVFAGAAVAGALFVAIAGNFFFSWEFTSTTVFSLLVLLTAATLGVCFVAKGWRTDLGFGWDIRGRTERFPFDNQLFIGLALTFQAVMCLVAVAVASSTRFGQVITLLICIGVFAVGTIHPYVFGRHEGLAPVQMLGWLFPKMPYIYVLEASAVDRALPGVLVLWTSLYVLCYVLGMVAVGVAVFQTRQVEAREGGSSMPSAVSLLTRLGQAAGLAAVVVVAPVVLFASREPLSWQTLTATAGLILGGGVAFVLWTLFGRGVAWSYWALAVAHLAGLVRAVGLLTETELFEAVRWQAGPGRIFAQTALNAAVLLLFVLPKTRRHFRQSKLARSAPTTWADAAAGRG